MKIHWRSWLLAIHRDFGYFFTGAVLVFSVSGIALNHKNDWNPSFIVARKEIKLNLPTERSALGRKVVMNALSEAGVEDVYRAHDFPSEGKMKIFTEKGSVLIDTTLGTGEYEAVKRRALFYQVNLLHLNPNRWWTWYSDIFSVALIVIVISGLFIARGRYGLKWRGAVLAGLGVMIPIVFLVVLG